MRRGRFSPAPLAALLAGCGPAQSVAPSANASAGASAAAACPGAGSIGASVSVAGGSVMLGDSVYPEEQRRRATLAAFSIDATEVTNRQFARFVAATGYRTRAERGLAPSERPELPAEVRVPGSAVFAGEAGWRFVAGADWRHPEGPGSDLRGREHVPVVHVALEDALAYARWAGRRLPTEDEWEFAARDGAVRDGPQPSPAGANSWQGPFPVRDTGEDGHAGLAPVGCYPASRRGLYDMIGNVWEWTAADATGRAAMIKGGSYLCAQNYCMRYRPGARQAQEPDFSASHIGFRTVALRAAANGPR